MTYNEHITSLKYILETSLRGSRRYYVAKENLEYAAFIYNRYRIFPEIVFNFDKYCDRELCIKCQTEGETNKLKDTVDFIKTIPLNTSEDYLDISWGRSEEYTESNENDRIVINFSDYDWGCLKYKERKYLRLGTKYYDL